ncbi:nucleotide sugar dehydrogenase [Micromonospora sp. PLK6-60]|uniref:nucleotide sugar dehydrogenase n=1 Tax=Micromonospora sp. PLK6-60 TaxID=2873383 RepID=UPI001CA6EE67|nr:nucleotide sugar dehydrogenase [Micromonospora sp. PLK6-60]MBY8875617.1 nucleotide sugar dehydrogenase [Micromonospora sp. PLK6-60]
MEVLSDRRDPRVAVIGLGYVGSCIAAVLADRGFEVVGVDVDPHLVDELRDGHCRFEEPDLASLVRAGITGGRLRVSSDYATVAETDVVLVTVGTPVREDGSLADEQLRGACVELSRWLRPGQLVVLKSTVPPGTTRQLVRPLLEAGGATAGVDFQLAFTPERLAEGTALRELRTFPIVAGGLDADSTRDAARFWQRALGVQVIPMQSLEAAEIVKLADNWWIDLNIALANELAKFSALFDVDVLDVIAAANGIPKGNGSVNILTPSVGVGGSCLTKDPWMVWHAAQQRGVEILTAPAGRRVNADMPAYTAKLILDELAAAGRPARGATVAVLGLSFKNNTGDLRATPVAPAVSALQEAGCEVRLHDPLVDPDEAEKLFGLRPVEDLDKAVRDADCLAVLAYHRPFAGIDFGALPVARPCLVFDGRAYYPKKKIAELRAAGYRYRGIGR